VSRDGGSRVVFDIETAPLPDAATYLEPITAPANYRDPQTIATYIAEKRAEHLERASLDPDLCRVVAIGWWRERQDAPTTATVELQDEATLLRMFWADVAEGHLVGFNCIGFDLPVLLRRSLYLGIQPRTIQVDRFRHPRVTDLLQVLSHNGSLRMRGLEFYASSVRVRRA
jgi:predicted PolB exonuclease-like 3'-5' exonuclease